MKTSSKSGFTLIEMMLVVAILVIIAAFTVSQLDIGRRDTRVRRDATRVQIQNVASAVNMFRLDTSRLPNNLNELATNPGIEGWSGPYHKTFKDPFGEQLQYTKNGRSFVIKSNADGTEGGPISSDDP